MNWHHRAERKVTEMGKKTLSKRKVRNKEINKKRVGNRKKEIYTAGI